MVQEYMEGETLREPLNRGALPLKRALGLATEIAAALAAAHAAGIIHRDLKPENIFVAKELGDATRGADDLVVDLRDLTTEVEAGRAMPVSAESDYQLAWVARNGQVERLPFEARSSMNLDLSPDEQRIALEILGDDGKWNIWIYEVERGGSQVLLTTEGSNRSPVWSPDGEWVFFASDRGGNNDIWKRRADRNLDAELVLDTEAPLYPTSISAEMLLFNSGNFGTSDVRVLALDTGQEPEMLVATAADELWGSFSPDGLFLAFTSNETGQYAVNVREISSGRTFPVSTSARGGFAPVWSQDGREIYYNSTSSWGILVAEVEMEPFSASGPVELSDIVRRIFANFDVTADQQRFLVPVPAGSNDTGAAAPGTRLNVVLNWFEELKRRVPTGR